MPNYRLKACARCWGDLYLDLDAGRTFWHCWQCGRHWSDQLPQYELSIDHKVMGVKEACGVVQRAG